MAAKTNAQRQAAWRARQLADPVKAERYRAMRRAQAERRRERARPEIPEGLYSRAEIIHAFGPDRSDLLPLTLREPTTVIGDEPYYDASKFGPVILLTESTPARFFELARRDLQRGRAPLT